ncbi:MAG TPA: DUF4147 domain-containing protein [Thermoplasmata archaeon]|nr:DUF4147 domain-containing protein [Thermoplasmata archaeon]HUJ78137.1 DUF4147 domain-containing protein [Thermoplasmata archaeon]
MSARMPFEPFAPERLPDPIAPEPGVDPIYSTIFRAAVTGADAYGATRLALRREGDVLRLGNRFVPADRYREIAFVAVGRAALSQTLAALHGLGDALTQGFIAGPDPIPDAVPFRNVVVPRDAPADRDPGVVAEVLELAQGLGEKDLLLLLLSPGASRLLTDPPAGFGRGEWVAWLDRIAAHGAGSRGAARVARAIGRGAGGGRVAAHTRAELVALVVDRGDGPETVGGGPAAPVGRPEREEARALLTRLGVLDGLPAEAREAVGPGDGPLASRAGPVEGVRPVAVAVPADALREVGEAVSEKRWRPVLGELSVDLAAEEAADRVIARTEELLRVTPLGPAPGEKGRPPRGLIVFASTTLAVPDGSDPADARRRFLRRAAANLPRRDATIGLLDTGGAPTGGPAAGGVVASPRAGRDGRADPIHPIPMRPGITDVGLLAAVVIPTP